MSPQPQQNSAQQSSPPAQTPTPPAKLQFQDLPADPHTPTQAEIEQQHQQAMVNAAVRLAAMQAHWGPEISSPGLSIALKEIGRTKTGAGTVLTYQITGSGFSPDEKLLLVRWPLNSQAQTLMGGIDVDAKGTAICSDTAPVQTAQPPAAGAPGAAAQGVAPPSKLSAAPAPNAGGTSAADTRAPSCSATTRTHQPIEIETTAAPGEAIRVALLTEDRKRVAAASVIPFPLAGTDKGCRLQVILGMKEGGLVLIDGAGFPPNAQLQFEAVTGDATRPLQPKTTADGRILFPLLAGAKGQASGETTVRFAGVNRPPTLDPPKQAAEANPGCAPSVSFHWGNGSYKVE
jgi:hypothetical protein